MTTLAPLPGFDWSRVKWGGPNEPRTEHCSYCGDPLDREHSVPLIVQRRIDGSVAEFCDHCMVTGWGFDPPDDSHEDWREANRCG